MRQITFWEFVRLLFALLVSVPLYFVAYEVAYAAIDAESGSANLVVVLFFVELLPAFFAVGLAAIFPSWRYKTIAATLILSGMTLLGFLDVALSLSGIWLLVGAVMWLSMMLTGGLLAALLWRQLKARRATRKSASPVAPATRQPRVSPLLLGLSMISLPAAFVTIGASALLALGYSVLFIFLIIQLPRLPIFILVAAFLAPLAAAWAALRALGAIFFSEPAFQPAQTVELARLPMLRQMIDEVCRAVGSKAPDNVLLHAQPTFFVTQGRMRVFGASPSNASNQVVSGRTLALGMPLLPHLTDQELKAILAHEFAHFSGRDTLYSVWVAPVYRSLGEAITRLNNTTAQADSRIQLLMSLLLWPSRLCLAVFAEVFASIDAIISRARELRADWIAATYFGSESFISALEKVVQYGAVVSEHQAQNFLITEPSLAPQHTELDPAVLQQHLDSALAVQESEFDSHPTLRTRIESLPVMQTGEQASDQATGASITQELREEEASLSASYLSMVMQVKELYRRYQSAALEPAD